MLQCHNKIDIEEAMSLHNDEILPITCLVIPSIMVLYSQNAFNVSLMFFCLQMESELQFQLNHGTGRCFMPQGAEINLLSGEHKAFTTRINQLCDVRLNVMSNPLYFSIQVRILFPL